MRVAVAGTGFIGPVHVEALRRAGQTVVGVLGSSLEKSRAAAGRLGIPRGYGDLDDLLADDAVEAVHLASPNRLHFEQARAVLAAGRHVLCEKPLAMNSLESRQLVEMASRSGLAAGVNYNCRYYPLVQETRARIAKGDFGEILHVTGSYAQDWLLFDTDFNWRVLANEGGELRAVADIGTHWLDLIQFVLQRAVTAVCADLLTVHPVRHPRQGGSETFSGTGDRPGGARAVSGVPVTTDDYGAMLLEFEGGVRGCAFVSQVTAGRKNCLRFEIAGARQSAAWNSESSEQLWLGRRSEENALLIRDPALLAESTRTVTDYPGGHNEGFPDTHKQLFRAFYGEIESGAYRDRPSYPTFADGHREIVLCEAVLASHRQRGWVTLGAESADRD